MVGHSRSSRNNVESGQQGDGSVIYLVRHGETVWNQEGRQQSHLDSPLTPKSIAQVHAAGRFLRRIVPASLDVHLETSPIGRAHSTAAIIAAELAIAQTELHIAPLLIEHNLGA